MVIQVIYDARCSICLRAIQLVSFREETLRSNGVAPTVQLNSWPSSDAERVLQGIPSPSRPASLSSKVWALLPSGLILPENQDDPMRLIYEMEYMAFVRLPTPEINTRVENTVLTPLQQQLAKGAGKLPWWSSPESLQLIARALKMEHFAVVDGFLPEDVCEALEQGARGAKPEMVRGATGAASKAQGADLAKVLNQPSRGDVVKFSDDGQMPGCPDFLCALDALVDGLKSCRDVAPKLRYVDWANGAMFAIYPGGASRYIKHVDNTLGTDGRRLTAVLYLNRHWSPKDGGCLRIFEPTMQNCQVKRDIEPLWNRLVLFWSTQEVPHEVLASYKDRLAVSVWFICGEESLRSSEPFQRLFCPDKLRCLSDRRKCLLRAAKSEAERSTLEKLPLATSFGTMELQEMSRLFGWRTEEEVQRDQDTVQDQMIRLALQKALDGHCRPDEAFGVSKVVESPKRPLHFEIVDDDLPTFGLVD